VKTTVCVPAKINRYLKICGVKKGKHLIETNFQAIPIYDTLTCEKIFGNSQLILQGLLAEELPKGKDNLIFRALEVLNVKNGYKISLKKNIPISAGLAGGSADAAAVLLALEKIESRFFDDKMCAQIGSDVKFSTVGGNKHGTHFGDILQEEKNILPECSHFVIGVQDFGLRTPEIYSLYDEIGGIDDPLGNDLQPAAFLKAPFIEEVLDLAKNFGAQRAYISGSGPTAVAEVQSYKCAQKIAANWEAKNLVARSIIVENKLVYPKILG
jgi:4-diphosphocytidyl-2-C-methyl-D-erythritol kinase